jgi:hypothetical protein
MLPLPGTWYPSTMRRLLPLSVALAGLLITACKKDAEVTADVPDENVLRPRSQPIEFTGITVGKRVDEARFLELVGPIFGEAARTGHRHTNLELQPGVWLTVEEDARTTDQVIVRLDMAPSDQPEVRRTVLKVPVSFAYGEIFIETVRVALARAAEQLATDGEMAPFHLEYLVRSPNGGNLTLRVNFADEVSTLYFEAENPRTSLSTGAVNTPAFTGEPYETLAGTVWFSLSRAEFDFFATRAYGITAGFRQNFSDFQLEPHSWLRLTVKPLLSQELVDVNFDVVTLDGRRIPLARAPASLRAGEQFQKNVLRLVENMDLQEEATPGSSDDWISPFHYDDPDGGGVVKVIAQGNKGKFQIAYAVESPTRYLKDVEFVPYVGEVEIPTDIPDAVPVCEELGSTRAPTGEFVFTFKASTTIANDRNLKAPLIGNIYGSVYRAADVTIRGPNEGTEAVADFRYEGVDVRNPSTLKAYRLPVQLPAGEYQVLGFMDIDGNADPAAPDPDTGDPVMIPIGAYTLECAVHPVDVEFAILLPPGY